MFQPYQPSPGLQNFWLPDRLQKRSEMEGAELFEYMFGPGKPQADAAKITAKGDDANSIDYQVHDSQSVGSNIASSAMYSDDNPIADIQARSEAQDESEAYENIAKRLDYDSSRDAPEPDAEAQSASVSSESVEETTTSSIETTDVDSSAISVEESQLASSQEYSDTHELTASHEMSMPEDEPAQRLAQT